MWDSPEDAFKELDINEHASHAETLAAYRKALLNVGFTRREALRLVEMHQRAMYDMLMEDYMSQKRQEEDAAASSNDDVDPDDNEAV